VFNFCRAFKYSLVIRLPKDLPTLDERGHLSFELNTAQIPVFVVELMSDLHLPVREED